MAKTAPPHEKLLQTLEARFAKNMRRHAGIEWADVQAVLAGNTRALDA